MKISVVITSYNQKRFLIDAIDSVLNQTFRPAQIIITDDASTDGSPKMIESYANKYPKTIVPIYNTRNFGVSNARNSALEHVEGDYVCCLDGDDRFLPTKLEYESEWFCDHPEDGIVFSNHYYIDENGKRLGQWVTTEKIPTGNIFTETFAWNLPKNNMFRNELINYRYWKQIGFYDCGLKIYEDYDMRVRLTKYLSAKYIDLPLSEYRIHFKGLSASAKYRENAAAHKYVYYKNQILLKGMRRSAIKYIAKRMYENIGKCVHRATEEILIEGGFTLNSRVKALIYYLSNIKYFPEYFNYKTPFKILIPCFLYQVLKKI